MPTRARKSAAAQTAAPTLTEQPVDEQSPTDPETQTEPESDGQASEDAQSHAPQAAPDETEPAADAVLVGEPGPELDLSPAASDPDPEPAAGGLPATKAQALANLGAVAEPTYHWFDTVTRTRSDPCRQCYHAGAPAGAGTAGCSHGQWVRVQDEAA